MTDRDLPHPGTPTEIYLAAVHDRLGALHDRLGELLDRLPAPPRGRAGQPGPGEVELREPAASAPAGGSGGVSLTPGGDTPGPDAEASRRPARPAGPKPPTKATTGKPAGVKPAPAKPARKRTPTSKRRENEDG